MFFSKEGLIICKWKALRFLDTGGRKSGNVLAVEEEEDEVGRGALCVSLSGPICHPRQALGAEKNLVIMFTHFQAWK